jgi:quercetin dioxygenase-like cupin family protein
MHPLQEIYRYMKKTTIILILTIGVLPFRSFGAEPKLENLMKTTLEGVAATEVVVSKVEIPPNKSLPRHWHPGEEFAYVLSGSVTLWQKGQPDIVAMQGEVVKVPLKQIHTAITGPEGVSLLVFRVHETGKPERVIAE